jgi:hypothetical protein
MNDTDHMEAEAARIYREDAADAMYDALIAVLEHANTVHLRSYAENVEDGKAVASQVRLAIALAEGRIGR